MERLSTVATGSTSVRTLGFHGRLAVRLRGLAFDDWQRLGLELTFRNASATLAGVPAERIVNLQVSKRQRSCATAGEQHPLEYPGGFAFQQRRWRAAERRHPTGHERLGSPTLQTPQDPILLPWVCFRGDGFPKPFCRGRAGGTPL